MTALEDSANRRQLGEQLIADGDFDAIIRLIDILISPGGCPWDQKQTVSDCRQYLTNEVTEVIEAIEKSDDANLEEELGDLLFLVAFVSKLGEKEGRLSLERVFKRILKKMVYRHPHVFGGEMDAVTPEDVLENWMKLKELEKGMKDKK